MIICTSGPATGAHAGEEPLAEPVGFAPGAEPPVPLCDDLALAQRERRIAELSETNILLGVAAARAHARLVEAEEAHRRQTEFLAVVAHELRRPLAPIRSAAEVLGRFDPDPAGTLTRLKVIIERQVVHISRLVDDLLDLSRASSGKLHLESSVVDLRAIVDEVTLACRPAMHRRKQRLVVAVPSCPLPVDGDPVRLAQVLGNLLDNACRYTPEGGTIELLAELADELVVLSVSDDGIGIGAEALPHVFEPFAQELRSPGLGGAGLGLGLAVVSELVEAHGGCVVAHSAGSGTGSRFVVTLPLAGAGARPSAKAECGRPRDGPELTLHVSGATSPMNGRGDALGTFGRGATRRARREPSAS